MKEGRIFLSNSSSRVNPAAGYCLANRALYTETRVRRSTYRILVGKGLEDIYFEDREVE
jgi:hypothetical protein